MFVSPKFYVNRKCESARAVLKKIDFPNFLSSIFVRVCVFMSAIVS